MPQCFQFSFGNRVTVIIDCFEVFTNRPSNLYARAQTYSSNKVTVLGSLLKEAYPLSLKLGEGEPLINISQITVGY